MRRTGGKRGATMSFVPRFKTLIRPLVLKIRAGDESNTAENFGSRKEFVSVSPIVLTRQFFVPPAGSWTSSQAISAHPRLFFWRLRLARHP